MERGALRRPPYLCAISSIGLRRRLVRHHADPLGHLVGVLSGARPRFRHGVFLYVSDRGLSRWVLSRRGYAAITFGHVVIAGREPSAALLRHERRHVEQYERLGLAFLPLYLLLYRRHGYAGHPLELDAAGHVALFGDADPAARAAVPANG